MTTERPAPSLLLEFPFEATPRWQVVADTFEDKERLRIWLTRSEVVELGRFYLSALRDRLDELELEEAA